MQPSDTRVFVGMSGGVDSSVAAALCVEQGYQVTGVYMKNWTQDVAGVECQWRDDLADAKSVAAQLSIPLQVFDFEAEYKQRVVDYMIHEYATGRTPNPDIICNQEIKFKLFLEAAQEQGADMIATGHYARNWEGRLFAGLDERKDQSYFLYRVSRDALRTTLFPLGRYNKEYVRYLAEQHNLPTANKPDSQGICFIGEVGIVDFLCEYVETEPGPIRHYVSGDILGEHKGALFYTIGQRHGLHIGGAVRDGVGGGGLPLYVVSKDMSSNTVFVTEDLNALLADELHLKETHWLRQPSSDVSPSNLYVRTRHLGKLQPLHDLQISHDAVRLQLATPERALAPGQSAVVYQQQPEGMEVLGGGVIATVAQKPKP